MSKIKLCAPVLMLMFGGHLLAAGGTNAVTPITARDFYNVGTKLLMAKHFTEAEQMFESSLAAQDEEVQPPALYNLAHAQFDDGMAALKKGPSAQALTAQGRAVGEQANLAIQRADSALAENELSKMVAAYLGGLGARRDLNLIEEAIRQALKIYGETLRKWQRAEDDFKSAAELNPYDANAARNARICEEYIAWLVDSMRQMQRMAAMLGDRRKRLDKDLHQIGGRIPRPHLPPGAPGDKDKDNGLQPESLRGLKEGATRVGKRIGVPLSPEEAKQILDGISLNDASLLPMEEDKIGRNRENQEKSGLTW